MEPPRRSLVVAVVIAAIIGFALGWMAGVGSERTVEEEVQDAARMIRTRIHKVVH